MKTEKCPKCGSNKIMRSVRVVDRNGDYPDKNLSVRIDRKPDALICKGTELVDLNADICSECGYTEMYVMNPDKLWQAYTANEHANS